MLNTTTSETKTNVPVSDRTDRTQEGEDEPRAAVPPRDYYMGDVFEKTIGNASSTCECCGDHVDGHNLDEFIVAELDPVDFSEENHVLLCRDCNENKDWEPRVRERRRNQKINSRLDQVAHWVSRPPTETLFLRRAAAGVALLLTATSLVTIMTALESGLGPLWDLIGTTNFAIIGGIGLLGTAAGYWLHLHEREKNDHRGTTIRDFNSGPWSVLAFTSGGLVVGTVLLMGAFSSTLATLGLSTYVGSAVFAFKNLEPAVRADRCHPRVNWVPRYDRELFGLRVSIFLGFAFLLAGLEIAALLPAVAIAAYLFVRKWYDLGQNWKLLYYNGGDDE